MTRNNGARLVHAVALVALAAACEDPLAPISPTPFIAVSVGARHTCAIVEDGAPYCWGDGSDGALGYGGFSPRFQPTPVAIEKEFGAISAGEGHTCGLTVDGDGYCWGWQALGQHGNAWIYNDSLPVPVDGGLKFISLDAGWYHNCALTAAGKAYCWGYNEHGQVGNGVKNYRELFTEAVVGPVRFVAVTAGGFHSCGIATNGAAYCWGMNDTGQLGDGTTTDAVEPSPVAGNLRFSSLSAGFMHTCGVSTDGAAYCWGSNEFGELGDQAPYRPGLPAHATPSRVRGDITYRSISAGKHYTCGIDLGGQALCWGLGSSGQLGNGSTDSRAFPANVHLDPDINFRGDRLVFLAIDAGGGTHTCGLTVDQSVYCWGTGRSGQLGNASTTFTTVPVRVNVP